MNRFFKPLLFTAVFCLACAPLGINIFAEDLPEEHVHTEKILEQIPASCTDTGLSEGVICSECREVLIPQEIIPLLSHNMEIDIPSMTPSCTQSGLSVGKRCSMCNGVSFTQISIPPTGHTLESIPAVSANCTNKGYSEGVMCSVCEDVIIAQAEFPADPEAHYYDSVEDTVCNGCGYVRPTAGRPTYSEQENNPEDGGCKSALGASLSVIASTALALWLSANKKTHV